uniref:Uncharacterized protein n=1 Tax=Anguilla anguilla TaxID=7936 RepID=A0A0E9T2N8_ANGAN
MQTNCVVYQVWIIAHWHPKRFLKSKIKPWNIGIYRTKCILALFPA